MPKLRLLAAAVLACLLVPTLSQASPFRSPTLTGALKSIQDYTIPASWAGVWSYQDSLYECTPRTLTDTDSGLDTLCEGMSTEPDTSGGFPFTCTGSVTDTQINLTCDGSFTIDTCTVNFHFVIQGTRTGDTAITSTMLTTTYTPSMCFFQPDDCTLTVSRTTRIAPPPVTCTAPTLRNTWGQIKTRYR